LSSRVSVKDRKMSTPIKGIIIVLHKNDLFLAKILVASIRYYYHDREIYLVKDQLNGKFSTKDLEKYFNAEVLDLDINKYGWCSAKIRILQSKKLAAKRYLALDADIVFTGKVLETLENSDDQFIVSPEYSEDPTTEWFKRTYYDFDWVRDVFPKFNYPGYTFNCGQMVVTPGKISEEELSKYIKFDKYPYWTKLAEEKLINRDQSLLNFILPEKGRKGELTLGCVKMMLWPGHEEARNLSVENARDSTYPYMLHWAGLKRVPAFQYMSHSDILFFFKKEYYKKLPLGQLRYKLDNYLQTIRYITLQLLHVAKQKLRMMYN